MTLYKKDEQWYVEHRKRLNLTSVEVTTVPVTPEQAIVLRTKFGARIR